jgi:hypothetical protein
MDTAGTAHLAENGALTKKQKVSSFDVHESVHRDTTMKITNKIHYID